MARSFPQQIRPSASEQSLGIAPVGGANGCLEATLVVRPGEEPRVRLAQLDWGTGVGWYAQRSLELKPGELQELARMLTQVAARMDEAPVVPPPVSLTEYRARRMQKDRP